MQFHLSVIENLKKWPTTGNGRRNRWLQRVSAMGGALVVMALALTSSGCQSIREPEPPHVPASSGVDEPQTANPSMPSAYYDSVKHAESPQPPNPQFRGLIVSGPARTVLARRQPLIVVRGMYRLQASQYPKTARLKLVAVDLKTREEFRGFAGQQDASPDEPPPDQEPLDAEQMKRMVLTGYFNTDLVGLLNLPLRSAQYRVWAELGTFRSNEITIEANVAQP